MLGVVKGDLAVLQVKNREEAGINPAYIKLKAISIISL
jgi:hypothetical protein